MQDDFKKTSFALVGIGGIKCGCCNQYIHDTALRRRKTRRMLKQKDNVLFSTLG